MLRRFGEVQILGDGKEVADLMHLHGRPPRRSTSRIRNLTARNECAPRNLPLAVAGIKSITEENWRGALIRPKFLPAESEQPAGNHRHAEPSVGKSREAAPACRLVPRLRGAGQYAVGVRGAAANRRGARTPRNPAGSRAQLGSRMMSAKRRARQPATLAETAEARRLADARGEAPWRRWGPYLSERQWGTVREDYSEHGNAWDYFPHDHARSRAYRWGEDGIAGFGDDQLYLCLGLALWNGRDPILKERPFGLTNSEGNHGEDVKEYYFFLDNTPTHTYMKALYKYPQRAFPYSRLVEENRRRDRSQLE